jgi:nucleoid DNA-binding protein
MAENKTRPTKASVADYVASRASAEQKADVKALMALLKKVTKKTPKMWGPSIVGYGTYTYTYESGRTGEMCRTGFAIRGREMVVYILAGDKAQTALLKQLGKHKMGKSCLYFKRLADLDMKVLEQFLVNSLKELDRRYPE